MESLRDRSRPRCVPPSRGRADYATSDGSRAASAAPSVGLSDQHAAHLMTRSCVVAFGSSAPRSICTRPSPAALRLQQAFEARLASYLSGRHSGCFLTSSSSPHYMHYIDPDRNPHLYASLSRKAGARQPPLPPSSHTADARRAVSTPRAWHSKTADSKVAAAAAARQQQATASDLRSSAPHPNLADATGKGQPPSSAEGLF